MKHPLIIRLLVLALLTLLLYVPLTMVRQAIFERSGYHHQAEADISRSWGGQQSLIGPMLVQTYHTLEPVEVWDENLKAYVEKQEQRSHQVVTFPADLRITGNVEVEKRYRGIYAVPVYRGELTITGEMDIPELPAAAIDVRQRLVLGISDIRGLRTRPEVAWSSEELSVDAGTGTSLGNGMHAELATDATGAHPFRIGLNLGGSRELDLAPLGGSTQIDLASNWPHPRFTGGYLPETRRISADGFEATWRTTRYATTARESLRSCLRNTRCDLSPVERVTVMLLDPVNVYSLNMRSIKYALLFIVVIFGVFFIFEALKALRIHPVQYALVGLGQALFFLLLLSLSEHAAFGWAYLTGAGLSVGLVAFYVSYVLGGFRPAAGLTVLLGSIYGALYVMLLSEDYALLLGSLLLFGILAAAMYLTRHLDWYRLEASRT